MPLRALFRLRSLLMIFLQFTLGACSASPLASPAAEPLPAVSSATPTGAATVEPVSTATHPIPTHTITPPASSQLICPPVQEVEIDPAAILELGPGPGIPPSTAAGEKLVIEGTVYVEDCVPLPGARLEVWQTDANGEYGPGHGTNDMRCCYLMGSVLTDSHGRYRLVTVRPAHYKGEQHPPPAHIHVEISHPQAGRLETEIVFDGDPFLPQNLRGFILVTLETVPGVEGYLRGVAEIFLKGPGS